MVSAANLHLIEVGYVKARIDNTKQAVKSFGKTRKLFKKNFYTEIHQKTEQKNVFPHMKGRSLQKKVSEFRECCSILHKLQHRLYHLVLDFCLQNRNFRQFIAISQRV